MAGIGRAARDLTLLDTVDAFARSTFDGPLWRVCRDGRDPLAGAASQSRWCDGAFDVLYTSVDRDGAIAEVHAYLDLQPVFPSKFVARAHELSATLRDLLNIPDEPTLARLEIEVARYKDRAYTRTQAVADAACFLGFRGVIAPSARWPCQNVILFADRSDDDGLQLVRSEATPIDWIAWRRQHRGKGRVNP